MESESAVAPPGHLCHESLASDGILWPLNAKGIFGYSAVFEDVIARFNRTIDGLAIHENAQARTFPPVLSREVLRRQGYLDAFPHLCGSVFSFTGNERQSREISAGDASADKSAGQHQTISDVVLTPAICYPLYQTLDRIAPPDGQVYSLFGWAYRHEPSDDPTRMRSFRMRELVYVGAPDLARAWRDNWLRRVAQHFAGLGLDAQVAIASDPFFGRSGRLLAAGQAELGLKHEILVPINTVGPPTAVSSTNLHTEHFTSTWQIRMKDGSVAHTACVAFGLERIALALFAAHGAAPTQWPSVVREILWPASKDRRD